MPDSEFARRLRILRGRTSEPDRVIAERAGTTRGAIWNALHVAGSRGAPPWPGAENIIRALGGDPEDFREAWEDARAGVLLTPLECIVIDLAAMRDDLGSALAGIGPAALASGQIPGVASLAGYPVGIDHGRATVWHAAADCEQKAVISDAADLFAWIVRHQKEAHADAP